MSLIHTVARLLPSELPPPKRQKGRHNVSTLTAAQTKVTSGTACLFLVQWLWTNTPFAHLPGAGEPGIGMLVSSYLVGYAPLLRRLIDMDLVSKRMLQNMARFACNPRRLVVEKGALQRTGARCVAKGTCIFAVGDKALRTDRCAVCETDSFTKPRMRTLLRSIDLKQFDAVVEGDDQPFAARVLDDYLGPKQRQFAANDAAKAERERNGLPKPVEWRGAAFKLRKDGPYRKWSWDDLVMHTYPTYRVVETRTNAKGRVSGLKVFDTQGDEDLAFWIPLTAHGNGWLLTVPYRTPLPLVVRGGGLVGDVVPKECIYNCGRAEAFPIPQWPHIQFRYALKYK